MTALTNTLTMRYVPFWSSNYLETLISCNIASFLFCRALNKEKYHWWLLTSPIMEGSDGKQWRRKHFLHIAESSRDTSLSDCLEHFGSAHFNYRDSLQTGLISLSSNKVGRTQSVENHCNCCRLFRRWIIFAWTELKSDPSGVNCRFVHTTWNPHLWAALSESPRPRGRYCPRRPGTPSAGETSWLCPESGNEENTHPDMKRGLKRDEWKHLRSKLNKRLKRQKKNPTKKKHHAGY